MRIERGEADELQIRTIAGWRCPAWEATYRDRGFAAADPVLSELVRTEDPFYWSELAVRRGRLTRPERRILAEAERLGLRDGFGMSMRPTCGTLVGIVAAGAFRTAPDRTALIRVCGNLLADCRDLQPETGGRRALRDALRRRQAECLQWAAIGKTSHEIGLILNLSRKTVDEHIENACRSLEVNGRIHAVARAVECGLISGV